MLQNFKTHTEAFPRFGVRQLAAAFPGTRLLVRPSGKLSLQYPLKQACAKKSGSKRPHSKARGFTLTELLVAMAIFVTLMGSLVTLFSGTVETVRAGYSRLASFEQGRTITEVMKRDLGSAFTARDSGDNQQFYGQGNGFSFIGANENGELSRISYAVVRVNDEKDFVGEMGEELGILVRRAMTQGTKNSLRGDSNPTDAKMLDGLILAQNLVSALNQLGNLNAGVASQAWNDLELQKAAITGSTWPVPPLPPVPSYWPYSQDIEDRNPLTSFLGASDTLVVELEAVYQMASLVRYEERASSDLDTFTLPGGAEGVLISKWAKFNPNSHNQDVFDFTQSEGAITNYGLSVVELAATNPNPDPVGVPTDDMRTANFMQGYSYITPNVIDKILRAKRREIWINMLSNSYLLTPPYDEFNFWRTQNIDAYCTANGFTFNTLLANPLDYTVAEEFLQSVILRDSDTATYTDIGSGAPIFLKDALGNTLDLFGSPTFFNYAQGTVNSDGNFLETFNANKNIAGYEAMMQAAAANPGNIPALYSAFDQLLLNTYTGFKSESLLQGSPLEPHIPSLIKVQFWVARHGVGAGDPPIKHWFAEVVDVPSGMTRKVKTSIMAER